MIWGGEVRPALAGLIACINIDIYASIPYPAEDAQISIGLA
jgi:hypothetical protein